MMHAGCDIEGVSLRLLVEVKTGRSNLDGGLSACLQNNDVFEHLK